MKMMASPFTTRTISDNLEHTMLSMIKIEVCGTKILEDKRKQPAKGRLLKTGFSQIVPDLQS